MNSEGKKQRRVLLPSLYSPFEQNKVRIETRSATTTPHHQAARTLINIYISEGTHVLWAAKNIYISEGKHVLWAANYSVHA